MKGKLYLFCFVILCSITAKHTFAQDNYGELYYHSGAAFKSRAFSGEPASAGFTGQSGTGANIDVVYHRIWWRINPDSLKGIKGTVTTYFKTIAPNVASITMDLRQSAFNNANLIVTYHGTTCTRTLNASNILTITLPSTIVATGTLDSVVVNYNGVPPAVSGAAQGYQKDTDPSTSQNVVNTLSESYEDRDWWPCKADMQDKIDSMDIIVNVPWSGADTFWVATNGRLVDSTISGGSRTFVSKVRYPIASYLVSVSVARYNRYYTHVNIGGTNTQVAYYLHRGKTTTQYNNILAAMNLQNQLLQQFSTLFGDYPFKREKHGFYDGLKGAGGMEHQTFSAIDGGTTAGSTGSLTSAGTLAHELLHQWFGDKVTFATWADIYLAEAFGRYAEVLAGEFVPATGINPTTRMSSVKTAARSVTTQSTRLTSFTTSAQVWSSANVTAMYDRGCMVVSMLRKLCGDAMFFQACRNYLDSANGSGYKSATTDSLKNNFSRVMGNYNLTPFFNDWVTGTGHPTTVINWNKVGAGPTYTLKLSVGSQTRSASSSVSYFHNVVVLRVRGALPANDTVIVFYDIDGNNLAKAGSNGIEASVPGNLLTYTLSFNPTSVTFDAYNQTMSAGSTTQLAALATDLTSFTAQKAATGNDVKLTVSSTDPINRVVLEKSATGSNFTTVADMQQLAATGNEFKYQFNDVFPYTPATYYRAKVYVNTGEVKYTSIAKVQQDAVVDVAISPNPASSSVNVVFNNSTAEKITVYILSADGKVVNEATTTNNFIHFDTQKLAAGTYVVKVVKQGQSLATQKLFVRH